MRTIKSVKEINKKKDAMTFDIRGLRIDDKLIYIKIDNAKIVFDRNITKYVKGKGELLYHILFGVDKETEELLKDFSVIKPVQNPWMNADKFSLYNNMMFKAVYDEKTKYFKVNRKEIPFNKSIVRHVTVNYVIYAVAFSTDRGLYQRLTVKQMRFISKEKEDPTLT